MQGWVKIPEQSVKNFLRFKIVNKRTVNFYLYRLSRNAVNVGGHGTESESRMFINGLSPSPPHPISLVILLYVLPLYIPSRNPFLFLPRLSNILPSLTSSCNIYENICYPVGTLWLQLMDKLMYKKIKIKCLFWVYVRIHLFRRKVVHHGRINPVVNPRRFHHNHSQRKTIYSLSFICF
jgi:hypothetical protein